MVCLFVFFYTEAHVIGTDDMWEEDEEEENVDVIEVDLAHDWVRVEKEMNKKCYS